MTFVRAVTTCLRKSLTFSGRASRSEYWWFVLFMLLALIVPMAAVLASGLDPETRNLALRAVVILQLLLVVPECAVATRRLHDIGKSGWWQLIYFVPLIGPLLLLWWALRRGDSWTNRFGPDPLGRRNALFVADAA